MNDRVMNEHAFQDLIPNNLCFGCGPQNPAGLKIKSYWEGDESVCTYEPQPHQAAGPDQVLNGGVIATLIDCHCICTAIARAYLREGRAIGSIPAIWYATGKLEIRYLRPTPMSRPVVLRARVVAESTRKTVLACTLSSGGAICAEADVAAVRVDAEWLAGVSP
jgi:acyl-coenzyme A thioesterase PaaI-like protein